MPPRAFTLSREYRLAKLAKEERVPSDHQLELVFSGHRVLACRAGREVRLVSADFRDWADAFPRVVRALSKLASDALVIEGFLCALDEQGRPSFDLLRAHAAGAARPPVLFAAADLLHEDGADLRSLPLEDRRARLRAILSRSAPPLAFSGTLDGTLDAALEMARAIGARGVLARDPRAPYPRDGAFTMLPCSSDDDVRPLSPPPRVTKPEKVLYPRDGIVKRDIVAFYADVAPVLLPLLRDRPVVCQRWPDGIDDFTWYQHRMPPRAPDYLRAVTIDGDRRIVIDDREGLCWLANQAALTFHGFTSRVGSLHAPDWVILDLDPGEATTWGETVTVALAIRKLLEMLELPSVPKTSGQKGLHVLVPIAGGATVERAHELARRLAKAVQRALPHIVTLETARERRGGRLLLDHLQSFVGKTLVLPYSLRAVDGAPVSTPLAWSEVNEALDPRAFTLRTLRARLDAVGDRAAPLLAGTRVDVERAIERLAP